MGAEPWLQSTPQEAAVCGKSLTESTVVFWSTSVHLHSQDKAGYVVPIFMTYLSGLLGMFGLEG